MRVQAAPFSSWARGLPWAEARHNHELDWRILLPGLLNSYEMGVTADTVRKLCHLSQLAEAVEALGILVQKNSWGSKSVFYDVLRRCVVEKDIVLGRRVHALTLKKGYESDTFLCNHIIRMYASHGSLQDAMYVFTLVAQPDAFMWSSIICAHVQHGQGNQAIKLYHQMRGSGVKPDGHVYVAAIQACARVPDLKTGQLVHADVLASGLDSNQFVCSCLVDMYAKCGSLESAQDVFDRLGPKNVVIWNTMIAGYSQHGRGLEALRLYSSMEEEGIVTPDCVTFLCLLQACASVGAQGLEKGRQFHVQIRERGHESDVSLANSLVDMYAKCGSLEDARIVFEALDTKDVVTWNAMIAGYSQQGMGQEALHLFTVMLKEGSTVPNSVTYACLLQACASVGAPALDKGKHLHAQITERGHQDVFVSNSLVNMYAKCGSMEDAHRVFDRLVRKNEVTWTTLIAGYSQRGMGQEALYLYSAMQEAGMAAPNSVTFVCLLQACASIGTLALQKGKELHTQIRELGHHSDRFVGNSLVNMYLRCGSLVDAQRVFDSIGQKDVVTWNVMIAQYSQQGMEQEALHLYSAMQEDGTAVPDSVTFVCLLRACANVGIPALEQGMQIHSQIREQGHQTDIFVASSLVNMYAKCGSIDYARIVFDGLSHKDEVTWNSMIAGYAQQGMGQDALDVYSIMLKESSVRPNSVTFVCLLQACVSVGILSLQTGKEIHAQIREQGHECNGFVANSLINMYAKCGSIEDARGVFDKLSQKDVVTWNAMIAGYSQQGLGREALSVYCAMQEDSMAVPDSITFVCILQACSILGNPALQTGKQLHAEIKERGLLGNVFVTSSLVNMYAKCGSLEDAMRIFDGLSQKDLGTWNAMIAGCSQQGMGQEALHIYGVMEEGVVIPDSVTFSCLLQACASVGTSALERGRQIHRQIREHGYEYDRFVSNSLVNMYAKCGSLEDSQRVFERLGQKDEVTWTALIAGYSKRGMAREALSVYHVMQEDGLAVPDSVTYVCLLQACASVGKSALEEGKQLHAQLRERGHQADDVSVGSSLVNMYAKCGSLQHARGVFDEFVQKDVVIWNAMLSGYAQQGLGQETLQLYDVMQQDGTTAPDSLTFGCLLQACACVGTPALEKGRWLHGHIRKQGYQADSFVANSVINMYVKCGSLEDASRVFGKLDKKDVVTWNTMIAGYSQQGMGQEALRLYGAMQGEGTIPPDCMTFVHLLHACAKMAALHVGRQLHAKIEEQGLQTDVFIGGSLINMYGKSGSMGDAQQVFNALPERDVVAWSALIAGYTCQGDADLVFDLVQRMDEDGIKPVSITCLSVLTVCSHAGLVNKGRKYFEAMDRQYGITPMVEHYTCMVDLLGRAGQLDEALALVRTMRVLPHAAIWHTLLGACRKWSNVDVGRNAFNEAVHLDQKDAAAYVLMADIYTGAQMWKEAEEMQARRIRMRAWKQPGQSWWTDMGGVVHSFLVDGDNVQRVQ